MLILKGLKFWMIPLSNLKLQHFSVTGADFAESQCNVHISCDQFQLLWWTSWPPSHRFHVLSVLLSGLLTHAHALPWLIVAMPGIIKVNSPSTWRSTCAKLFTGLTVSPGCPRTTTFRLIQVIRMGGLGGSQGVSKGSRTYDFLRKWSKVTCCSHVSYSGNDIHKFSFLIFQNWIMIRRIRTIGQKQKLTG